MRAFRSVPLLAGAFALVVAAFAPTASSASTAASHTAHATSSAPAASAPAAHHASSAAPAHSSSKPAVDAHIAAIRQNIEQSRHNLRAYHWRETAVVSLKGEDKSTMINSCTYDATGKLVRTPQPVPANAQMNGIRGATPSAERAQLSAYEHSAAALLHEYIPINPARLQKDQQAGRMTTDVIEAGQRVRLTFKDYQKAGDQVSIELNPTSNQVLGIAVNSFLASPKEAVNLNAEMASLPDGTTYPARIKLDTPAKQESLTVTYSDFQKKTS